MNKTGHPINSSKARNHHIINKTCCIQTTRRKKIIKGRKDNNKQKTSKQTSYNNNKSTILPKNCGMSIIQALKKLTQPGFGVSLGYVTLSQNTTKNLMSQKS